MTEGDALYRAILDAPDDDAPRLVWADWLEENGDPEWAAFIRLQCEQANLDPSDLREHELGERLITLSRNRDKWTANLGSYARNCGFWRGLPDWFELTADQFLGALSDLRQLVPAQCLCLQLGRRGPGSSHDWGVLETIRCLDVAEATVEALYPQSSLRGWVWLLQSSRLRGLQTFAADFDETSLGVISALAGTDWPNLRELSLRVRLQQTQSPPMEPWRGLPIGPWEDLAAAPWFPALHSLDLSNCFLDDDGLDRVLDGDRPMALTRLVLTENSLGPSAVRRLASRRSLVNLRRLAIGRNGVGATVAELLRSPALPNLSSLDVSYCTGHGSPGSPDVLRAIAAAARPGQLQVFSANHCLIGTGAVARFVGSVCVDRLEVLSLTGNELSDEAAVAIAESTHLANLRRLDLRANRITDFGLRALARSTRLGALRQLAVRGNALTAGGMRDPAVIDFARRLVRLDTELSLPTEIRSPGRAPG